MNRVMLPGELQRAIERARQAMLADPVHALRPFYRRQVYGALGPDEATHARAHAGIRCARRVLPVWQGVWPDDPLPERLITMAGRVLRGEVGAEDTRRTAGA